MPTRSALLLLFLVLVGVPVGAAAYLGVAGLERERSMLIAREKTAMDRRADDVREALVRKLQQLYREEANRPYTAYLGPLDGDSRQPVNSHFQVLPDRQIEVAGKVQAQAPAEVDHFARSDTATAMLEAGASLEREQEWKEPGDTTRVYGTNFVYFNDIAARGVVVNNRVSVLQGFRIDPEQINRRYLDPASPETVVARFDERVERVMLVRDDDRLRVRGALPFGLPQTIYRSPAPKRRSDDPVLLPPGYTLAFSVHPAASLAGDLDGAEERLAWTLAVVALVVGLGALFLWRAVRAESRLASRKAEFVNAVSHELRTPLTSIRMYADMLKEGWVEDEATAKEYFGLISAESERLARLVNNVLDFSRIEKGSKEFEMRVGDPAPVVREVAEILRPYLKEKGFDLDLELPESLPACSFDRDALTQILVNLIDNAVKHGKREVRLEAEAIEGRVVLRVLDRGPGIPDEERERIFLPFTRGGSGTAGSGLGLALVRHYVTAHDGTIDVRDRDGGGAAFALSLPVA